MTKELVVAHVDLRVVADNPKQLRQDLDDVQAMDRTHIVRWQEIYYDDRRKPNTRSTKVLEAIEVVNRKLREKRKAKTNADDKG